MKHANERVQFKQTLGEFELVKKKIAFMAAHAFAMEATTAAVCRLHRPRRRGLHARDRHAQGVVHRAPVDDRQRHAADLRRPGLLHRPAATSA